jgi:hypothetical protein
MVVSCQPLARTWNLQGSLPGITLCLSSSGGGLFRRPMTRKGHGALLFYEAPTADAEVVVPRGASTMTLPGMAFF